MTMPLSCNLGEPERRARQDYLEKTLKRRPMKVFKLSHGIEFQFVPEGQFLKEIYEFMECERVCCPFLEFTLNIPAQFGSITLKITGPEGTEAFLSSWLKT